MPAYYKRWFLFLLGLSLFFFILLIILTNVKSPILDKKNFFTLSAKSPEYDIPPIDSRTLLVPPPGYYPDVSISPNARFYSFINFIKDWELFKKKYDSFFYASKTIAELVTWGNDISWEKQLTTYQKYINKEIDTKIKIPDPRLRLDKLILLNSNLLAHQQKLIELLYSSNKNNNERKSFHLLINKIFSGFNQRLAVYLPKYQNGTIIYPLYNPLLDREYGAYEAQFETIPIQNTIYTIEIDGKQDFLYWNWNKKINPQKEDLKWYQDENANPPLYLAEISPIREETLLMVITYQFPEKAEIRINNNYKDHQDLICLEQLYPNINLTAIKRIFTFPKNQDLSQLELYLRLPGLSSKEIKDGLAKFSLTFYKITDPEPKLILTKKSVIPDKSPAYTLKKINPFTYLLMLNNSSFFNGRQVRYNLSMGWQINEQKILSYLPGIYIFRLTIFFIILSLFYGLCLLRGKTYDQLILKKLVYFKKTIINKIKLIISRFNKIFTLIRFLFFILALFTLVFETFFHTESFDSLVFFTALFWIIFAVSYRLESKFSLIGGFVSFIFSIIFLFFKQKPIPDNLEIISDKFAVWTIIFFIISLVETIVELTNPNYKARSLKVVFSEIIKDWYKNTTPLHFIKKIANKIIVKIINVYKPKSRAEFTPSIVKLTITLLIIVIGLWSWITYQKNQKKISLNPVVIKLEPRILYQSSKFILTGKNLGSFLNNGTKLMSSHGQLTPDFWTDTKIYFTIPLEWKPGVVKIWIKKQVEFENKKYVVETKSEEIRIIPRTDKFTPADDLFFEQLKTLDKETLKINGYE